MKYLILLLAVTQFQTAAACEALKLYADLGPTRFAASGFAVTIKGTPYVVTADHFLPLDRVDFPILGSLSKKDPISLTVRKRDWGSDLMILEAKNDAAREALEKVKTCRFSDSEIAPMTQATLLGYPAQDFELSRRNGVIADPATAEARIARPLRQLKILTLAEKGMSGGAVVNAQNELLGIIQSEWTSMTETSKGGAFALHSQALATQILAMLSHSGTGVEMPLPFRIRRAESELQFGGFRIHNRPEAAHQPDGAGGGHPDGIGGELPDAGVEIVGLTGEPVPEDLRAMEKVLRNVQSRGGVRMVVRGTENGQPITDMIALGRLLLMNEANPELDYSLINVTPETSSPRASTPETLMEEAIVLISLLNNANPALKEYSQLIKATYERWLKSQTPSAGKELFEREAQFQPELDRILDIAPELWNKVVDLQSTLLLLKKSLYLSR